MKPGKVIERLLRFGPPLIAHHAKVHARCVLATAIGLDALAHFEIAAVPLCLDVEVFNQAAWDLVREENFDFDRWRERGAFVLSTQRGEILRPIMGPFMYGHLAIHAPGRQVLIDLDLQQLSRRDRGIQVPPAASFAWPHGTSDRTYRSEDGIYIRYCVRDDRSWEQAPDWCTESRQQIARVLVRAIRANRF